MLQIYFKYTSSILQPIELYKKKYTSSLYYFNKRSIFEAHFVKLNQHFRSILQVYFKYTSTVLQRYTSSIMAPYLDLGCICLSGPLYG